MTERFSSAYFLTPLRGARLWVTFLWALALGVGLAGLDWAERAFETAAASQVLILLPTEPPEAAQRQVLRTRLALEPAIGSVQWRAPADLTRQIAGRYPVPQWQGLFPADEGWLPWVLEVRPAAPLDQGRLVRDFIARRELEGTWRLILWDNEPLHRLERQRLLLRAVGGLWLTLLALGGAVALLRLPWPAKGKGRWVLSAWSAALGLLGPAAVWSAALLAGEESLDDRSLAVALLTGFILATLVAPVLRLRGHHALSITLSEAPHERVRQGSGSGQ